MLGYSTFPPSPQAVEVPISTQKLHDNPCPTTARARVPPTEREEYYYSEGDYDEDAYAEGDYGEEYYYEENGDYYEGGGGGGGEFFDCTIPENF